MVSTAAEVPLARLCSRQGCKREAVSTLTYVYADSTAVIGPLSVHNEPHAYDLCEFHAQRMTAPRGWEVLRVEAPVAEGPIHAAGHASLTPMVPSAPSPAATPAPRAEQLPPVTPLSPAAQPESEPDPHESARSDESAQSEGAAPTEQAAPTEEVAPTEQSAPSDGPDRIEAEDEDSLVNEIFGSDSPDDPADHRPTDSRGAQQPKGMRIPHLRRRPRA